MILPLLLTVGILTALYVTRGQVMSVRPQHWYLVGLPQEGQTTAATPDEIEVARAFVQRLGFQNVTHSKTTFEGGHRVYWFKGLWSGTETALRSGTPVQIYEVIA